MFPSRVYPVTASRGHVKTRKEEDHITKNTTRRPHTDTFGPSLFQRFRTEENVRSVLKQVYGNASAVDDELVQTLLQPGQDDGAEEVFLKVLRAPAGPSPESILPNIQVPIIAIWGEGTCIRTHPSLAPHFDLPLTSLAHTYHPAQSTRGRRSPQACILVRSM